MLNFLKEEKGILIGVSVGVAAQGPLLQGDHMHGETQILQKSVSRVSGGRHERVIPTHSIFAKIWVLSVSKLISMTKLLGREDEGLAFAEQSSSCNED